MNALHFVKSGKLKYVDHTLDIYWGYSMDNCFGFWKNWFYNYTFIGSYSHYWNNYKNLTDSASAYISSNMKLFLILQFKVYYKYTTQSYRYVVIEKFNHTFKDILNKQKGVMKTPRDWLYILLTLIF